MQTTEPNSKSNVSLSRLTISQAALLPYPCLPVLYFFLTGSLPFCLWDFGYANTVSSAAVLAALTLLGLLIFPANLKRWSAMIIPGALAATVAIWMPWRNYDQFLLRSDVYAEIRGVIIDDRLLDDDSLKWLEDRKKIKIKLTDIRLSRYEPWTPCLGTIYLATTMENDLKYGQTIYGRGALQEPYQPDIPGGMDYRNFLKIKGIKHIFRPETVTLMDENVHGLMKIKRDLFRFRERILGNIVRNLDNRDNQKILAAMTLGFRQGLDSDDRQKYLRSGIIHLFAISGLHVGILFSVLLLAMTVIGVPFTFRYFFTPAVLLVYVVATGAAPSAMRAWLMVSVWSVGRGLKLPVVTVNTVLFAALLLLIYNPFYIFQSGFQFSFAVVICLVQGWIRGKQIIRYINERRQWIPNKLQQKLSVFELFRNWSFTSVISMLWAWLGGLGLTAYYNNLFLPASVLINIFVCIQAWIIIFLSTVKVAVSFLFFSWPDVLVAKFLSWNLALLRGLGEAGANYGCATQVAQPSITITLGYYCILFFFLFAQFKLKKFYCTGMALTAYSVFGLYSAFQIRPAPEITVLIPHSSVVPSIVIDSPGFTGAPILINTGTRRFGYSYVRWLQARGVSVIDTIIVLENRVDFHGACDRLAETFGIRSLMVRARDQRNLDRFSDIQWNNGCRLRWLTGKDDSELVNLLIRRAGTKEENSYHLTIDLDNEWQVIVDLKVLRNQHSSLQIECISKGTRESKKGAWQFEYSNLDRIELF